MASSAKVSVSARERARQANARRLAEAQNRIKQNEADLVRFFDARETVEKATDDLEKKIARLREEAAEKVAQAERDQAEALVALKDRGESIKSIAELTDLSTVEVGRMVKSARPAKRQESDQGTTASADSGDAASESAIGSSETLGAPVAADAD